MERLKLNIQRFATSGSITTPANEDGSYFYLNWSRTSYSISDNTSTISWGLYINAAYSYYSNAVSIGDVIINNQTAYSGRTYSDISSGTHLLAHGSVTIPHNNDGTKTFDITISGWTWGCSWVNKTQSFTLNTIPRYATCTQSLRSKTETSITMNWSSDSTIDYVWYSTDNGTNWTAVGGVNSTSGSYTISNLSANTTYNIKTRVRRKDSQLTTDSSASAIATYNWPNCTSAPNFTIGNSVTLQFFNPLNRTFDIRLWSHTSESFISDSITISGTSYTFTPDANTLYTSIPNAKSSIYNIDSTYNTHKIVKTGGSYSVNETTSKPTFSDFDYEDTNSTTLALTGDSSIVVQNYSNVRATISTTNKAVANNSATMSKYNLVIGNNSASVNYSDDESVSATLNNVSSNIINLYAEDSRGLTTLVTKTATLKAYTTIQKNEINVERAGNVGTGVTLTYNGTLWGQSFGSVTNTAKSARYRFKKTNEDWGSTWNGTTTITPTTNGNNYSFTGGIAGDLGNTGFSAEYSFNVEVEVFDELSSTVFSFVLGTGIPHIAVADDGIAIKQPYDDNLGGALQVNGDLECTSFQGRPWNFSTENTTDTWVPVASGGEWKHRAIPTAFNSTNKFLYHHGSAPSNLNDAKTHGTYHIGGTYTNAPSSGSIYGILVVYVSNGNTWVYSDSSSWIWQIFYDTSGNVYRRYGINSATMTAWEKMGVTTLWTNSNVGNQFSAQTINISNLSSYKYIDIIYYPYYPGSSQIVKVERHYYDATRKMGVISDNFRYQGVRYNGTREYTVNAGSIYFADAKNDQNNTDNNWYKPYQIIGYK